MAIHSTLVFWGLPKTEAWGENPRQGWLCVMVDASSLKWDQTPPARFPRPPKCFLSSNSLCMLCKCLSRGYTNFRCSGMDKNHKIKIFNSINAVNLKMGAGFLLDNISCRLPFPGGKSIQTLCCIMRILEYSVLMLESDTFQKYC